jgi:hypothetical protein
MRTRAAMAFAAFGQGQRLERQHRQHAGHQVEDQAAGEREQQRGKQADAIGCRSSDLGHDLAMLAGRRIRGRGCPYAGGQGHLQDPRHRLIADAIVLAALEFCFQGDRLCRRVLAQDWQWDLSDIEINNHIAEMFVLVRLAFRKTRRAQRDSARAEQAKARLVAIQVITRRRRQPNQQFRRRIGDGIEFERLIFRQRQPARSDTQTTARRSAHERDRIDCRRGGLGRDIRSAGCRHRHIQRARLGRVTHANIGAALVLHLEAHRRHAAGGGAGEHGGDGVAIGFNVAEEFVAVLVPGRQLQRVELEGGIDRLHREAMLVQVIARRHFPGEFDALARHRLGREHIGLVHRQQVVHAQGLRANRKRGDAGQQHGQGRDKRTHHSGFSGVSGASGRVSSCTHCR